MKLREFLVAGAVVAATMAPGGAQAQDLNGQAQQLCAITVGALAFGQYPTNQVLGQQALQVAMQQTNGTGVYGQLQQMGQLTNVMIENPHFDQDQQFGQLFHFYCTPQQQMGALNWEIKYAPSTGKVEYFAIAPAGQQQMPQQQPQFPQQQPQFPQQQPQQQPQAGQPQWPQQQPQQPQQQPQWPQQQPQWPQQQPQQQPQFPQQQPQQQPQAGGQQGGNPTRDEACKMFPGMC